MRRQKDHALEVRADINVTSLVDVAFVLLIIFIITAPILQGGIEVQVPQGQVQALQQDPSTMLISLDAAGRIFIAESEVQRDAFTASFNQLVESTQPERIWIKADSTVSWGQTFFVISTVAETGISYAMVGEELPR